MLKYIGMLIALCMLVGCGSWDDFFQDDDDTAPEQNEEISGRALLGPLNGATVTFFQTTDLRNPIYETVTGEDDDLELGGVFPIPTEMLQDDALYIVEVRGGVDIDADDDGVLDHAAMPNNGIIRLVASGERLKKGDVIINILTELVYQKVAYQLFTDTPLDTVIEEMDRCARLLLTDDLNNDAVVDQNDLSYWHPRDHRDMLVQGWGALEPCIAAVHDNENLAVMAISRFSGIVHSIETQSYASTVISGSTAYVHGFSKIALYDVSSPNAPRWEGDIASESQRFAVSGDNLFYINFESSVLEVVDVRNPEVPSIVGSLALDPASKYINAMAGLDDAVYLISDEGILTIVDITDPTAPAIKATLDTMPQGLTKYFGLSVVGNYLFLSGGDMSEGTGEILVVDVSDAELPVVVCELTYSGYINYFHVQGSNAFFSYSSTSYSVLNISDPTAPVFMGSVTVPDHEYFAVSGDYAYLLSLSGILYCLNFADPLAPDVYGKLAMETDNAQILALAALGEYAYVNSPNRLDVVQTEFLEASKEVGSTALAGSCGTVVVSGNHAYLAAGNNGMEILDISDPTMPIWAGSIDTPGSVNDIVITDGYAYIADGGAGLQVIDISDPGAPVIKGAVSSEWLEASGYPGGGFFSSARGVDLSGDHLFLASSAAEWWDYIHGGGWTISYFQVIDVSNPNDPNPLAILWELPYAAVDVSISNDVAYVTCDEQYQSSFQLVDVSAPADPVLISSFAMTDGFVADSAFLGANTVVVAGSYGFGLQVIDFSDLNAGEIIGQTDEGSGLTHICISGEYLYATNDFEFQVYDIVNPSEPVLLCHAVTPESANGIHVADGYVYLTGDDGFYVFKALPSADQ